jgi:hypothetical protein
MFSIACDLKKLSKAYALWYDAGERVELNAEDANY